MATNERMNFILYMPETMRAGSLLLRQLPGKRPEQRSRSPGLRGAAAEGLATSEALSLLSVCFNGLITATPVETPFI